VSECDAIVDDFDDAGVVLRSGSLRAALEGAGLDVDEELHGETAGQPIVPENSPHPVTAVHPRKCVDDKPEAEEPVLRRSIRRGFDAERLSSGGRGEQPDVRKSLAPKTAVRR
jgi:hypothetical protein